jgi:hypothetical protein
VHDRAAVAIEERAEIEERAAKIRLAGILPPLYERATERRSVLHGQLYGLCVTSISLGGSW